PLFAYLAILPWAAGHHPPDGDEPYNLLITHSLAYDFDADLTNNYAQGDWRYFMDRPIGPQPGDPVGPEGELYSRHNDLLPTALALDRILALDDRAWKGKDWLGIGLPVLLLPVLKIRFMLLSAPLVLLGWWYGGRQRRAIWLLGLSLVAVAGSILLYNTLL